MVLWPLVTPLLLCACPRGEAAELLPGDPDHLTYEADFSDGQAHDWTPAHNLGPFGFAGGHLHTRATGDDAFMAVGGLDLPTADISHLLFRLRSDRPGATQVYFATTTSPDPAQHPVPAVSCPGDGEWHDYEVQLGGLAGFTGSLTMLRLDPVNGGGEQATIGLAWVRLIRKAPVVVCTGFAANRAVLEPGEECELSLKIANFGGGSLEGLTIDLEAPRSVAVERPTQPVRWSAESRSGRATWKVEARGAGQPWLRAVGRYRDKVLVQATTCLPVIDWPRLPAPGKSRSERELSNEKLSLLLLGEAGKHGSALVRVRDAGEWKNVALLAPLGQVVYDRDGVAYWEDAVLGYSEGGEGFMDLMSPAGGWTMRLSLERGADQVGVSCGYAPSTPLALRRFSGPVLRVGVAEGGQGKDSALFPGIEFLEGDERSSDVDVVGEGVGYRPSPAPYQVTCPSLAVLREGVLCGLMWDPEQWWNRERHSLPIAEFASPNLLDDQPNHRMACFVPDAPWREPNQPVAARPYELGESQSMTLAVQVVAAAGADITDAVPRWYATYGMPETPPLPHAPERALDLCLQGWAQTLWFPNERGFNNHWHVGQTPYWDPRLATNILMHGLETGETRWMAALDLKPDTRIVDLVGSMFRDLKAPETPAAVATQRPNGLWPYEPPADMAEKVKQFTGGKRDSLGKPGAFNVGVSANQAAGLLAHALRWGDERSFEGGINALRGMEHYRVPRGCQGWEVHLDIPDVYAAAVITDCFRMGYELTGDRHWLEEARYWAYTGLPFLYSYRVPDTGPGASAHIPWPKDVIGRSDLVFQDPAAHQPTPWGAIPVFGTSFYVVSWFGNLVQWCGLCWARSTYALLECADDLLLRAAADGVVGSGIQQTFDREPYVGLLPDTWHLGSNVIHPAFIGPVRLEDPLRLMIDAPEFGAVHTRVALREPPWGQGPLLDRRAHVSSCAPLSRLLLTEGELRWVQRFPVGQVCETMVVSGVEPATALAGDRTLPRVEDLLAVEEGWQPLPQVGGWGLRVKHQREWETISARY